MGVKGLDSRGMGKFTSRDMVQFPRIGTKQSNDAKTARQEDGARIIAMAFSAPRELAAA